MPKAFTSPIDLLAASMSTEWILASNNRGKLAELEKLLQQLLPLENVRLQAQASLGIGEAEETACTFVENALLKARHACREGGKPSIADDSGIAVDALDGAPGVWSARYAGEKASDRDNNEKLLAALEGLPPAQRGAAYHCVLVFMRSADDPVPLICHGQWRGRILEGPRGEGGFGYDPLFWVEERQCSAAELSAEEKNTLSHRAAALRRLVDLLSP